MIRRPLVAAPTGSPPSRPACLIGSQRDQFTPWAGHRLQRFENDAGTFRGYQRRLRSYGDVCARLRIATLRLSARRVPANPGSNSDASPRALAELAGYRREATARLAAAAMTCFPLKLLVKALCLLVFAPKVPRNIGIELLQYVRCGVDADLDSKLRNIIPGAAIICIVSIRDRDRG